MGCSGSKNNKRPKKIVRKNTRKDQYKKRTGFTVTEELIDSLEGTPDRDEYVINPDIEEFFSRDELPQDSYIPLLKAIATNKRKEYTNLLTKYKISTMDLVIGYDEKADFGNKKNIDGTDLNPIHWAVYTNNLHAIKTIIENQIFNVVITGKVPTNTGMANESEISIDVTNDVDINNEIVNLNNPHQHTHSEKRFGSIPRSLLLFWPIDQENEEVFNYLWNTVSINWGLKTLRFILTMVCIKDNPSLLESLLLSSTFEKIVNSLAFHDSMDFLEAFIIKNDRIPEELKEALFEREELVVYDFVGELMCLEHFAHNEDNSIADNSRYREVLRPQDYERIKSSPKAMAKINELKKYVEYIQDSDEQEEIYEILENLE